MNKNMILEEIAKRHHIILDSNDPIFAVVTANELMFDEFLEKIDKLFIKHKVDLESYKVAIVKELKEYSKDNSDSLKNLLRNESDLANSQTQAIRQENSFSYTPKEDLKKYIIWFIIAQVIFLLIGLIIGLLI